MRTVLQSINSEGSDPVHYIYMCSEQKRTQTGECWTKDLTKQKEEK
jgi:hypothetical protein